MSIVGIGIEPNGVFDNHSGTDELDEWHCTKVGYVEYTHGSQK